MRRTPLLSVLALLLAAACGGDDDGLATTDGGGGGGPDGAPALEPLHITTGDWSVPGGREETRCLFTQLPGNEDFLIKGYHAHMLPGSHHFNMFWIDPTAPGIELPPLDTLGSCAYDFAFYLAGSQWESIDEEIPGGLAIRVPAGSVLILESHYVNAGEDAITGRVDVTLDPAAPEEVTHLLGLYFNVLDGLHIAPGERVRESGRCPVDDHVNLVFMTSHSHWWDEHFEINLLDEKTGEGETIYENDDYGHPLAMKKWLDPIVTGEGQEFEWACNEYNGTDADVWNGNSAQRDEMCIMAAYYWPDSGTQPYCLAEATRTPR